VVDISDLVSDYSLYTPEMITSRATVKEGDILIINTGYHRYSWDLPDVYSSAAQGGVESKEFGFLVRHPGPSPDFFKWALDMKLKLIGVDCGCAEHPMNTNIRYMHAREFEKAEAKLRAEYGKSWDEMFPQDEYYELTHITMPKAHLVLAESIVGDINKLNNQRAWIMIMPIPFMEVETAWARVVAHQAPDGMDEEEFFQIMDSAEMLDMAIPFSVQTPQWAATGPSATPAFTWGPIWTVRSTSGRRVEPSERCLCKSGLARALSQISPTWSAIQACTRRR
jgi:kynurenine formamidase